MIDLSVAIVSYNAKEELARCLDSVGKSRGLAQIEIVVADNASSDGSAEMVAERFPGVRLLRGEENLGFARASNLCWQEARSPLVLFLNSDTVVRADGLARMVAILRARPEVGALGPRLRYEDGAVQMSFGASLSLAAELRQKLWNAGYSRGKGPLRRAVERAYAREREVDWVSAACLLTRRDLLETVEGFDPYFFMYSEDVDLCARLRATGARILYTPEVEVFHALGGSARKNRERVLYESHRSRLYFYEKHRGPVELALLRAYTALKASAAFVFLPRDRDAYRRVLTLLRHHHSWHSWNEQG